MINPNLPLKILIIRNDKIGDFTLALPVFAWIKSVLPSAQLSALVPAYTQPIAALCPAIDQILSDPGANSGFGHWRQLQHTLRQQHFDASISLYSSGRINSALLLAGIARRYGPATKLAQVWLNRRLRQRRSLSSKPEYQYNLDLASYSIGDLGFKNSAPTPTPPYLNLGGITRDEARQKLHEHFAIAPTKACVFLHPGSGGSAGNLRLEQYAQLADSIYQIQKNVHFIISAGPTEAEQGQHMLTLLPNLPCSLYHSQGSLAHYLALVYGADAFIGGSTGPLHLAGALDIPTAGFYTRRRSATALRWQTLNSPDNRLAFYPPESAAAEDMSQVNLQEAADKIVAQWLS